MGLVCVVSYRLDGVVVSTSGAGEKDPGSNPGRGILFNATFIHSGNLRSNLLGAHAVRRLWLSKEGTSSIVHWVGACLGSLFTMRD